MKIPVQQIDHKSSEYHRPNQKWICGWAKQGKPCPHGPNGKGKCAIEGHEYCSPAKEGDRYVCNRPIAFGGKCENGPKPDGTCCKPPPEFPPCQPHLSLRGKRGRTAILLSGFVLAFLILIFSTDYKFQFFNPGPLSASHAALTNNKEGEGCQTCHSAAGMRFSDWALTAMSENNVDKHDAFLTQQCIDCHFEANPTIALSPHNNPGLLQSNVIADILQFDTDSTSVSAQFEFAKWLQGSPMDGTETIACVSCHQEHQSLDMPVAALSSEQCQSCHQNTFHSFENGHPEFVQGKIPIQFDHGIHQDKFPGKQLQCNQCHNDTLTLKNYDTGILSYTDNMCVDCHTMQDSQTVHVGSLFETGCSGCHNEPSRKRHTVIKDNYHADKLLKEPILVFGLPAIEHDDWPEDASADEPSPFLSLLMLEDNALNDIMEEVVDQESFYDWLDSEPDEEAINTVVKSTKSLLADIPAEHKENRKYWENKLSAIASDDESSFIIAELASQLALGSQIQHLFVRNLFDEDFEAESNSQKWIIDIDERTLMYQPQKHGDAFQSALAQFLLSLEEGSSLPEFVAEGFQDNDLVRKCSTCHEPVNNQFVWSRQFKSTGFEKFSHQTHLTGNMRENQCATCHTPIKNSKEEVPNTHIRFEPINKNMCNACHTPDTKLDTCATCHDYHTSISSNTP